MGKSKKFMVGDMLRDTQLDFTGKVVSINGGILKVELTEAERKRTGFSARYVEMPSDDADRFCEHERHA